jgi:Flp pilus assembly protein TadG
MQHRNRVATARAPQHRCGKLVVLLAVLLPVLISVAGLVLDGGLLMLESRETQHVSDAAATAAAAAIAWNSGDAEQTAQEYVHQLNNMPSAVVDVHNPPSAGLYAGRAGFIEVTVEQPYSAHFLAKSGLFGDLTVTTRSVAGTEAATAEAAVVVLDPDPPGVTVGSLPLALPSVTPLLGGLEVLGLGRLRVDGAVLVNNTGGGFDENGDQVGESQLLGLKHACSCTPLVGLTHVLATDIRVVGGVDDPDNYGSIQSGEPSPLKANRRPVPDPYADLPAPTLSADSTNVVSTEYGGVTVLTLPLQPPRVLHPGVYDWIQVIAGRVIFEPGVYIIRGVNPVTQLALNIVIGNVQANGVMFYITNTSTYSPSSGLPDASDGETPPAGPGVLTLVPSALIDVGLFNSQFSGLNDPSSPFDGLLIYQRRQDRRPIVIVQQGLLGNANVSGNVYAKWSHVILTANGTLHSAFACGSLRVLSVLDLRLDPYDPLPPAYDIFLVE